MNDLIAEKKSQDGILEGLSPEEAKRLQKRQARLTDFILHLIQALLGTGYYTTEHPESKRTKEGLYHMRFRFCGRNARL